MFFLLLLSATFGVFGAASNSDIPEPLKPWIPWVEKDHEAFRCPNLNQTPHADIANHICAWPSALTLNATDNGGQFSQNWQVFESSWLPLPGGKRNWPMAVKVNDQQQPVVLHQGRPSLYLKKGQYHISGRFDWPSLPESLQMPEAYPFVEMSVNGQTIAFPKIESGELWLSELKVDQAERDTVTVYVHRKLSDGPYLSLETRIRLDISGKRREQMIGKVLPSGFVLKAIEGELSAFLDADGSLYAKLQPGSWTITVYAVASPTILSWQRPAPSDIWPQQEIWAFAADESVRTGKLSGGAIIDGKQADMPPQWLDLPGFVLNPTDTLTYKIIHRGKSLQQENKLNLRRQLWLNFDGDQFAFVDNITGTMTNGWRMSMQSPYQLHSGEDRQGPVLITSDKQGESGIENRNTQLNLTARGTLAQHREIPVTGWDSHFETVSLSLNLPPAYRLFGVIGADQVDYSWLGNWTIWHVFIVMFAVILAGRLIGAASAVVTALTLILIFQESLAPVPLMINLLIAIAIGKFQPLPQLAGLIRIYLGISLIALAGATLWFSANQFRTTLHPQLENKHYGTRQNMSFDMPEPEDNFIRTEALSSKMQSTPSKVFKSMKAPDPLQRYQSNAVVQAGPGVPAWSWNEYQISWSSPVAKAQSVTLLVQSATITRTIKVLGVVLLLLWLMQLFKDHLKPLLSKPHVPDTNSKPSTDTSVPSASSVMVGLLLLMSFNITPAKASDFPSNSLQDQLRQRVLAAPKCDPQCATINHLEVNINAHELNLILQVHVLADTAIPLPETPYWRAQRLKVNGKAQQTLYRQNGWTYLPFNRTKANNGIIEIQISGEIAPIEQFQLQFKDLPQSLRLIENPDWQVIGVNRGSLTGNTLEFIRQQKQSTTTDQISRYTAIPMVQVNRLLKFEQQWNIETTVTRLAPNNGSITIDIPLLASEQVILADKTFNNNALTVTLPAGAKRMSWHSVLPITTELNLTADDQGQIMEQWQILSSPIWHVQHQGIVQVQTEQQDYYVANYFPYPGESLTLTLSRPTALQGTALAIDKVHASLEQGERSANYRVEFNYRATRGGEHSIQLPEAFALKSIKSDEDPLNLQSENGKLTFPVSPGEHTVELQMRADQGPTVQLTLPPIDFLAPVSNITAQIDLTQDRWILWSDGPVIGPAVLYWGELMLFLLLATLLVRIPFSPLKTTDWLLLGFGFSLYSWKVFMLMIVWFGALTLAKRRPETLSPLRFNLSQVGLMLLTLTTLLQLVTSIPSTLLGSPEMSIVGNNSWGNKLNWLADQSSGALPHISVINIPTLYYKGIMLLWVLWLSFALIQWIKWAWQAYGHQGYWRQLADTKALKKNTPTDYKKPSNETEGEQQQ